jgi:hypothetical protein
MISDKFFEVEGVLLEGGPSICGGNSEPSSVDYPEGSLYLQTDGTFWQLKVGVWLKNGSGGTSGSPNMDGGFSSSIYGGTEPVDGGSASGG